MLQIIQHQKNGELFVEEVPAPILREGGVLVKNAFSLISAGTERTSVETAKASLIGKARSRPDLVKQVFNNIKKEGLITTYKKVKTRLDNFKTLGYSTAGVVIESSCDEFQVGDRVACAGAGYASHAEVVFVPKNLATKLPKNVDFDEAAFTTLGAIAMQGVRQADVKIGESVAIIGLGLLGQLTLQIIKAAGCNVIGIDISHSALELAKELGADKTVESKTEIALKAVDLLTGGLGVDAVIITAATKSNEPIEIAGNICRDRGRVVIVGAVRADVPRSPFYEKEIEIKMSRSYGPGRYDYNYEEKGTDYPAGYVRWTENRNMDSFLKLVSEKKINLKRLITHRFPIKEAVKAYDVILGKTNEKFIGILIEYPQERKRAKSETQIINLSTKKSSLKIHKLNIGFIGAGNFAQSYLLPNLKKNRNVKLEIVVDYSPITAKSIAKKFGFHYASTDFNDILKNDDIHAVFISTTHDSHASLALDSLKNGKNVYVEKPLAINKNQLSEIDKVMRKDPAHFLMVGYNRRFSRPVKLLKSFFHNTNEPLVMNYRVNVGSLPKEHWLHDPEHGGRIIGEGCHFIDTMKYISDSEIRSVFARPLNQGNSNITNRDNVIALFEFENGSIGSLSYFEKGDPRFPKEYLEIFGGEKAGVLNDFHHLELSQEGKLKKHKFNGEKGHREEIEDVINSLLKGEKSPIPFDSIFNTTMATFLIIKSIETGITQKITE